MNDNIAIFGNAKRGYSIIVINDLSKEICSIVVTELELYNLYLELKNKFERGGEL